jgi:type IV secretory pathway TrbD component
MAHNAGGKLMMAGAIIAFIGLCIVLIRVLQVPQYWIPLLVGVGIFLVGLVRWLTTRDS